uniref:Putative ribonuclease H-like domain-containing protein n=1 Tax=Tanacetum cinerariifolium TaxID=118510 RepID=A0A6L2JSE2_TANCI|nr:putative ribonuclease H-like domain-containing protein [Tanacetum cinerariifolium]
MALPEDHLAKFHKMDDAKEMWKAIKSRFGGNDKSKKMQKYLLKQQFEEIHGAGVLHEDANQKFLRSLPSSWSQIALIMRTKPGFNTLSFDDLYNNLRVFKRDVKGTTASSSPNTQNLVFMSADNTSSINDVSPAYSVSSLSVSKSQKEGSASYTDEINDDDLQKMDLQKTDLKWQLAMISIRIEKFHKRTGILLETAELNRIKIVEEEMVEAKLETLAEDLHLIMVQKLGYHRCNSGCDNEVQSCSKTYAKSYARVKKLYNKQREKLGNASVEITAYTLALKKDDKTDVLAYHKKLLAEALKEKEDLKTKVENWQNSFKDLSRLLNTQMSANDNFRLGYGNYRYGNILSYKNEVLKSVFMNKEYDLENTTVNDRYAEGMHTTSVDESDSKSVDNASSDSNSSVEPSTSVPEPVVNESKVVSEPKAVCESKVWTDAPIIEEYKSDSDDDLVFNVPNNIEKPSFAFTDSVKHVKSLRENIKETGTPNHYPKIKKQDRHSHTGKGLGYARKSCVVYGSFSHLIRDCDFHEKRMAKQAALTKSKEKVLTKTGKIPINDARQNFSKDIAVKASAGYNWRNKRNTWDKVFKYNSGSKIIKSVKDPLGRLKHMTWNKAHLVDYQEFKGGTVAFGSNNGRITGKGKIKAVRLNFEDVYYVEERKHYNLFSMSQMCDKKNKVLFTYTDCLVLSLDFKLPDKNQNKPCLISCSLINEDHPKGVFSYVNTRFLKMTTPVLLVRKESNTRPVVRPRQVAERKNRTLIEAARTMLADLFLPNTFCAEAVNTACYVLNRVLVTKPQNNSPYELLTSRQPIISYLRPFGCHVTILNTFDQLGKFDGKSNSGFLVGYSLNSKAFRVYNLETKRVEENLDKALNDDEPSYPIDPSMPHLEDIYASPSVGIFTDLSYDDEGVVTDFNNLETTVTISPTPTTRIHTIHPKTQILRDLLSAIQTKIKRLILWQCKKHTIMATSTIEAEYIAAAHCCGQVLWIQNQLLDYGFNLMNIKIYIDNESTICIVKNHVFHLKTKHIEIRHHFIRDAYEKKLTQVLKIHTDDNVADLLTKAFDVSRNKKDEWGVVVRNKARLVAQGHRAWYATLSTFLEKSRYRRGAIDKTLFIKQDKKDIMLVQVNVDDIIFGSTNKSWCDEFEELMKNRFSMSFMGELTFFLGLQVKKKEDGIFISQDKYVAEILKKFDFLSVKTASTPIETQKHLVKDEEAVDVTPKTSHLQAVKMIFRYLKGQPKLGLWYLKVSSFDLEAYSNSDYAGANLDRKSIIGGWQFLSRRLISWQYKKQTIMATSTTEAEYVAASHYCGQVLWIRNQLLDYGFNLINTKIYIDNESTICIVKNHVFHSKTKHIEIWHHFIRDAYEKKLIQVLKIHTDDNVADLLTKAFDVSSKELASPKQTALGKDESNPLIVDSLLKTIWSSMHHVIAMKHWLFQSKRLLFWSTAKVKTVNDEVRVQALIDAKRVTMKESSILRTLKLDDEEGISCLANDDIFTGLANMGYKKMSDKLTFYKAFFSPQWKFLIHTILQCLSAKTTSWNKFSSTMASTIICLATNQKFNFSVDHQLRDMSHHQDIYENPSLTKKVFANMKRVGTSFFGVITPFFENILVSAAEEVGQAQVDIAKLKDRVHKLEKENKILKEKSFKSAKSDIAAHVEGTKESFKQGRMLANMDEDVEVNLEKAQAKAYNLDLQHLEKVLSMQDSDEEEPAKVKEVLEIITTAKIMTEVVTTAQPTTAAQNYVIEQVKKSERQNIEVMRHQALKRKPLTEAQARKNMMIYLKNIVAFKMNFFKGMTYSEIRPLFKKHYNSIKAFLEKEEKEVTVQEKEIEKEGSKRQGKSIEQDIAKKQRMDEEARELKRNLHIMANDDDDVYTKATPLASKVFLLVEKKYPLTYFTLQQMLDNVRLEVEKESEMSLELLSLPGQMEFRGTDTPYLLDGYNVLRQWTFDSSKSWIRLIELYKTLVNSYNVVNDLFELYGKAVSLKRGRKDKDKDKDPPAGLD